MRLGMAARAGIVASVLWMLIAPLYLLNREMSAWQDRTTDMQTLCLRLTERVKGDAAISKAYDDCSTEASQSIHAMTSARGPMYRDFLGVCAGALVAAWMLVAVIRFTVKWVLAGRQK